MSIFKKMLFPMLFVSLAFVFQTAADDTPATTFDENTPVEALLPLAESGDAAAQCFLAPSLSLLFHEVFLGMVFGMVLMFGAMIFIYLLLNEGPPRNNEVQPAHADATTGNSVAFYEGMAKGRSWAIKSLFVSLVLFSLCFFVGMFVQGEDDPLMMVLILPGLVVCVSNLIFIFCIAKLSTLHNMGCGCFACLFGGLIIPLLFPIFGLVILVRSGKVLREAGYTVGVFHTDMEQFSDQATCSINQADRTTGSNVEFYKDMAMGRSLSIKSFIVSFVLFLSIFICTFVQGENGLLAMIVVLSALAMCISILIFIFCIARLSILHHAGWSGLICFFGGLIMPPLFLVFALVILVRSGKVLREAGYTVGVFRTDMEQFSNPSSCPIHAVSEPMAKI